MELVVKQRLKQRWDKWWRLKSWSRYLKSGTGIMICPGLNFWTIIVRKKQIVVSVALTSWVQSEGAKTEVEGSNISGREKWEREKVQGEMRKGEACEVQNGCVTASKIDAWQLQNGWFWEMRKGEALGRLVLGKMRRVVHLSPNLFRPSVFD